MSSNEDSGPEEIPDISEINEEPEEQTETFADEAQEENEGEDTQGNKSEDEERKEVKPKRVVRNPQPKLNEQTLKGSRGLTAIQGYFERVKFKGRGYEEQDLNVLLKTYEYWCHRLFPKFPFDSCIERLEKLGSKKATLTHIKRIREDLLLDDEIQPRTSDNEDNIQTGGYENTQTNGFVDAQNDAFDLLAQNIPGVPDSPEPEITEEQLERMRQNKERAERLRQERLRNIRQKAQHNLGESSQLAGSSNSQLNEGTNYNVHKSSQSTSLGINLNEDTVCIEEDSSYVNEKINNRSGPSQGNNQEDEGISISVDKSKTGKRNILDDENEIDDIDNLLDDIACAKSKNRRHVIDSDDSDSNEILNNYNSYNNSLKLKKSIEDNASNSGGNISEGISRSPLHKKIKNRNTVLDTDEDSIDSNDREDVTKEITGTKSITSIADESRPKENKEPNQIINDRNGETKETEMTENISAVDTVEDESSFVTNKDSILNEPMEVS